MNQGLRNRGKTKADAEERRKAVEDFSKTSLSNIASCSIDASSAEKNIENMIGWVQVPLGFAGPLKVNGTSASGEYLVPLATTEGALLATINRGCSLVTASGGANAFIVKDEMTRGPVFRVKDLKEAMEISGWVEEHFEEIKKVAESTTKHGKLLKIDPFAVGRSLFLRFHFQTGDAMGMNIATIASEAASRFIEKRTGAVLIAVSGNICVDKKASAMNYILGRGKLVLVDAKIPGSLLMDKMRVTPEEVEEACYRKNLVGSGLSLSYGSNAHLANMLAAVFIATGQDPAQVVEGSMGTTTCEAVDGDLYISVRLPSLEVGTVGGGTRLPTQKEALSIMGCWGEGKAAKLAEIVGAVCLAGELSTLAAQRAGELGKAHQQLGR